MKKINLFLVPLAISAFALASCGQKEISKEEAGAIVKKAAEKETPSYTSVTVTLEIAKYKVDIKGEGANDIFNVSEEQMASSVKELGFEEVKVGAKTTATLEFSEAKEMYKFATIDEVISSLDEASSKDSKLKYYAVGDGVKVEYSYSLTADLTVNGSGMKTTTSTYSYIVLNEYAIATEMYSEGVQSGSFTMDSKSASYNFEFGLKSTLELK